MSKRDASTIAIIQKKVEKLLRDGEDLQQMKRDVQEYAEFKKMIVHSPYDG